MPGTPQCSHRPVQAPATGGVVGCVRLPHRRPARDVIVASFTDPLEAQIALGRLQAEGIRAHLDDGHTTIANWEWRLAIGGAKLRVPAAQADEARSVLAALDAGEYALDADEDHPTRPPHRESLSSRIAWAALMLFNLPLPWRRKARDDADRAGDP